MNVSISIDLSNYLPVIGIAASCGDEIFGQVIYDNRSMDLLTAWAAATKIERLCIHAKPSLYLKTKLDKIFQSTYHSLPHTSVLVSIPKHLYYVTYSYEGPAINALKVWLTSNRLENQTIKFKSSICSTHTTITNNNLQCFGILPNLQNDSGVLTYFQNYTTPMARRRAHTHYASHPLICPLEIHERQEFVASVSKPAAFYIQTCLKRLPDLDKLSMRLYGTENLAPSKARAHVDLFPQLHKAVTELRKLKERISGIESKRLSEFIKAVDATSRFSSLLDKIFDLQNVSMGNTQTVLNRENNYTAVATCYAKIGELQRLVQKELQQCEGQIGVGKVKLVECPPYGQVLRVPKNCKLDKKLKLLKINKNETLFTTDMLQKLNSEIECEAASCSEVENLVILKCFGLLREFLQDFDRLADETAHMDILITWNDTINMFNHSETLWRFPEINMEGSYQFERARHPLLTLHTEQRSLPSECVSNSYRSNATTRISLITGANMGGKSTYSRQQALILIMAQYGMRIPAAQTCSFTPVVVFWARIGGSDNPSKGISTFMMEAAETAGMMLSYEKSGICFYVIDELGRGTSVEDGLKFAKGILRWLSDFGNIRAICATHFHELTEFANDAVELKRMGNPQAESERFKLFDGIEEESQGILLASRMGFPESIISACNATATI